MTAALPQGDCCLGLDYVRRDLERNAIEHQDYQKATYRLERRFEEEIGSLREAMETETDRRREDMQTLMRMMEELRGEIRDVRGGGPPLPPPPGPVWPADWRSRVWLTIGAGVVGFLVVVGWADNLAEGFLEFLRGLILGAK